MAGRQKLDLDTLGVAPTPANVAPPGYRMPASMDAAEAGSRAISAARVVSSFAHDLRYSLDRVAALDESLRARLAPELAAALT